MLQGNVFRFGLSLVLIMACSAAKLAISLGTVARATLEVGEAVMEVEDTVEEATEEVQAVEVVEVRSSSSWDGLSRSLTILPLLFVY